jgi:predicted HicB family RNase H-like nuclease
MQLQYKGFSGTVRYSAATEGFYGEVTDTPAVISFQSSDLDAVESAFQEAVERYLRHVYFLDLGVQTERA